jgi:hypothetical protein
LMTIRPASISALMSLSESSTVSHSSHRLQRIFVNQPSIELWEFAGVVQW